MEQVKIENSSQIASLRYDGQLLDIEFKGGSLYRYRGITPEQFDQMKTAESVGKFFYANIKGKAPYCRLVDGVEQEWIDPLKKV